MILINKWKVIFFMSIIILWTILINKIFRTSKVMNIIDIIHLNISYMFIDLFVGLLFLLRLLLHYMINFLFKIFKDLLLFLFILLIFLLLFFDLVIWFILYLWNKHCLFLFIDIFWYWRCSTRWWRFYFLACFIYKVFIHQIFTIYTTPFISNLHWQSKLQV